MGIVGSVKRKRGQSSYGGGGEKVTFIMSTKHKERGSDPYNPTQIRDRGGPGKGKKINRARCPLAERRQTW